MSYKPTHRFVTDDAIALNFELRKIQQAFDAASAGDITAVTAGTALSGGGASGDVTLDFAPSELATVTVATDDEVVIADTSDSGSPAVVTAQSIADLAPQGDITGVTAGTAISGGGSSGTVTVNFAPSELSNVTVATDDKVVIADTSDSDAPKTVTTASIAALAPQGDITGVTAGTALTGGGTTGAVTLNFAPSELSNVTVATDDKVVIADTSDSDNPKTVTTQSIADLAPQGDITGVTAGNGLSGGGTTGTVALALDLSELSVVTVATGDYVAIEDITDNSSKKVTAQSIADLAPQGDITGVTAGTLLTGGGSSGAVTLNVDLSEATTSTSDADGDYFLVTDAASAQYKLTKGNIALSGMNNDSGWTSNTGDITGVTAGTAISGGGSSGTVTVNFAPSELSNVTVATDDKVVIADTSDSDNPKTVTAQSIADLAPQGDITGVTAGTNLNGGGSSGAVTVNLDTDISGDTTFDTNTLAIDSTNNRVGIGITSPVTPLEVQSDDDLTDFTSTDRGAITISNSDYNSGDYQAIDFRYSTGATAPSARVAAQMTGSGSYLSFGTSNNYGLGPTNEAIIISPAGNVTLSGSLSKGSGTFDIPHPTRDGDWRLRHSFIEGPQADLIYRGTVTLSDGTATVDLDTVSGMTDGTWTALCRDPWTMVASSGNAVEWSLSGKVLTVTSDTVDAVCSWIVMAERQDDHMKIDSPMADDDGRLVVEYERTQDLVGLDALEAA